MRRILLIATTASLSVSMATAIGSVTAQATSAPATGSVNRAATSHQDYVVLYTSGATAGAARAAITAAGGTIVKENSAVGYALARSTSASFATSVSASPAVEGTVRDQVIGAAPREVRANQQDIERLSDERAAGRGAKGQADVAPAVAAEPLANRQWDMRQIGATPGGSYAVQPGDRRVLVGVIDTGIDGTHPDLAANFDAADSRNFTTDIVSIDGPCEVPSCVDPANVDDNDHGTHVASTIASPINGLGVAGVAPNVQVANLRAGQDSGFFFLQPTLDAITYAGDIGVDVINMSFFTDPWLFNCVANPADSAAEQAEQRVIREATQRALDYARRHGVLSVAALGNEHTDLGNPTVDTTSPDFPVDTARTRTVDNTCITVPTESRGVVSVSSTGPSTRLAYYSNYGTEQTDVSAPGGDFYDSPTNTGSPVNLVLAAYPQHLAEANGDLNADGTPNTPFVVRDCNGTVCGYYQYLQGTSMAAPHAVGVAALVVSQYGKPDRTHPGLTLDPKKTERILRGTAVDHACPQPRTFTWTRVRASGVTVTDTATCEGPTSVNGFYGDGIVNAYAAVTSKGGGEE